MARPGLIAALDGMTTRFTFDAHDDRMTVERQQDVEPILKENARLRNLNDGYSPSRDLRRVAAIPNIVIEKWFKAGINVHDENDWPKIAAMLDSPDYAYLRTAPGRVSRKPSTDRTYFGAGGSRRSSSEIMQDLEAGIGKG
ncbi:MAG TPA: hypothetical protein VMW94_07365, partial [Actinomycetes bacterium]|nr:hypothetical protein [Actinomycetes bacterium]